MYRISLGDELTDMHKNRATHIIAEILGGYSGGTPHIDVSKMGHTPLYSWEISIGDAIYTFYGYANQIEDTEKIALEIEFSMYHQGKSTYERVSVPREMAIRVFSAAVTFVKQLLRMIPNTSRVIFSAKKSDADRVHAYQRLARLLANDMSAFMYTNDKAYPGKVHFLISRERIPYYDNPTY